MIDTQYHKSKSALKSTLVLSAIDFFIQLPNFFIILGVALFSNSSIVWVDLVNTFGNVLKNIILLSAMWSLCRNNNPEYSFNTGKYETFFTMINSMVCMFSYFVVLFFCLNQIRFPQRPSDNLFYAIFIKLANIVYDFAIYFMIRKNTQKTSSKFVETQDALIFEVMIFDIVAFFVISLSYFFRNNMYYWYVSPITSMILVFYFAFETLKGLYNIYTILIDKSLSESQQLLIMKVLAKHFDEYESLISLSSHYDGVKPVIKFSFRMKDGTMDYQMSKFTIDLTKDIKEYFSSAQVEVIYNPIE